MIAQNEMARHPLLKALINRSKMASLFSQLCEPLASKMCYIAQCLTSVKIDKAFKITNVFIVLGYVHPWFSWGIVYNNYFAAVLWITEQYECEID